MSQINDALKRASQTDRLREGAAPGAPAPPMPPFAAPARSSGKWRFLVGALVPVLICAAFFLLLRAFRPNRQAPTIAPIAVSPQPSPAPAPPPVEISPPPAIIASAPPPQPALPRPAAAPSQPSPPPPPAFPPLKLQAIFYSKASPRALINGQTAAVGDAIAGAQIEEISPAKVTVAWRGQTKSLSLGSP